MHRERWQMAKKEKPRKDAETTPRPHLEPFKWKAGQSGNPTGRPKGARHKLTTDFVEALYEDFKTHGREAISEVRADDPGKYLDIVAKLVPKDVDVNVNASDAFVRLWESVSAGTFKAMAEDIEQAEARH